MPIWVALAIQASIMLVVFAIGLQTAPADALFLFRHPPVLLKSLVARNVAMPLVAILLVRAFPLHPAVKGAIVLLSVTPVPPILPPALLKAGARAPYVSGLLVSHSILAVVLVPVTLELLNLVFVTQAHFGPLAVAESVGISILAPLVIGIALRYFRPARAARSAHFIGMLGTITLLAALLPLLLVAWQALPVMIGNGALLVMALFVASGLVVGHTLGAPNQGDRTALALATASRHPGLAIAIAGHNFPEYLKLIAGAVIIYLLLSEVLMIPYRRWRRKVSGGIPVGTLPAHS
jgi:BASS family bile acid:Na+ symporter